MKRKIIGRMSVLAAILLALSACSSGDNGVADSGGIDRGGITQGTISGFGSVIVNGVRFDSSQSEVLVNGVSATEADLAVGQLVTVTGSINADGASGSAARIEFEANVQGPVESIDLANGSFIVLGQAIVVESGTVFADGAETDAIGALTVGQIVEVSGFTRAGDNISAAFIRGLPSGNEFRVAGPVSLLDLTGMTFNINGLRVDFGSAVLSGFPNGVLENGLTVRVRGISIGAQGELIVSSVEFEPGINGQPGDEINVEGFITDFVSASGFDVAGLTIDVPQSVQLIGGILMDLGLDARLRLTGRVDSDGAIVAELIEFVLANDSEIEAPVDAVDASAGTLSLLGIQVTVTSRTLLNDDTDAELRPFRIEDIREQDYLEVAGTENATGSIEAMRIERKPPKSEVQLEGTVDSVSNPNFAILGITIETGSETEFRDKRTLESVNAADFFNEARDKRVDAFGQFGNGTITARLVTIDRDGNSFTLPDLSPILAQPPR